jgi:hypothetical protein
MPGRSGSRAAAEHALRGREERTTTGGWFDILKEKAKVGVFDMRQPTFPVFR